MERDFLGLGSKNHPITVKEEAFEGSKDSVAMRGSGMQWSFSNKVSATPQFLSFNGAAEETSRKTIHDPMGSSGFMTISTVDAFDSNLRPPHTSMVQKNLSFDKQGANQYGMTNYVVQHLDAYQVHRPHEMRIFPVSNQQNPTISVSLSSPVLQSHVAPAGHNVVASSINSPPLGGVPIITPVSVPLTTSSVIGTTELRNGPKSSGAPSQLTIFYAGSVCVYDDVSPEKAQAIMLLAGNGSSIAPNKTLSTAKVQEKIESPCAGDGCIGNKANAASLCSGLPSSISVTSSRTNELPIVKPVGVSVSTASQKEPPKTVSSILPASGTLVPAVAVPQARKASLARFLEKRKERVMSTSPYNASKKSPDCDAPISGVVSLSINYSSSLASPSHQLAAKGAL